MSGASTLRVMNRSSSGTVALGLIVVTVALGFVALWGAFANPSIDSVGYSVPYTCRAPWETVLNEADNWPGGDPPADAADIAAWCRAAGEQRFAVARVAGIAALVAATAALAAGIAAARRTHPRVDTAPTH